MAVRQFQLDGIGPVSMYKRRGVRSIKLSIGHDGTIRVTLPLWAPYKIGLAFVEQKRDWVLGQMPPKQILVTGQRIGKGHRLVFRHVMSGQKPTTRLAAGEIRISLPPGFEETSLAAQQAAKRAAVRALKQEAANLLPERLKLLAQKHGFTFRSVKIKELKGRWGSCNQQQDIVLNCFLMQLPWELIDYVILHELLHTRLLAHGRSFWSELDKYVDNLKDIRRIMKSQQPTLMPIAKG